MIISVEKAKQLVDLEGWTDERIERKLKAIEQTIRAYTNNNFQARAFRRVADIVGDLFICERSASGGATIPFDVGDTVQVTESAFNEGLYEILSADDFSFTVTGGNFRDESSVLVTKIVYPADVIDCCVNLLEWEKEHRAKVGIKSETLSRHSVTYFDLDSNNQIMGYPVSLLGCLKAYRKARF